MMKKLSLILASFGLATFSPAQVVINEFMAANETSVVPNALPGTFQDWIEIKNNGGSEIDLGGWHLTDNAGNLTAWTFPANTLVDSGSYLVVFASNSGEPDANGNLHTNFKLSQSGEYLALVKPDLTIASEFGTGGTDYPEQSDDVSYGIHPSSGLSVYFSLPTPGNDNNINGIAAISPLSFSPSRGHYQSAQSIEISTTTPGATIYYTTDGTPPLTAGGIPTASASPYSSAIDIDQTTVIRAAATKTNYAIQNSTTHTYILLDIDGAGNDGSDPGGLNTPFLTQTQPAGYGPLSSGDYNMDTRISRSTSSSTNHVGKSIAQAMLEGMREIPTISIALPKDEFSSTNGIYYRSTIQGLERACSAEFIPGDNDVRPDFQENCGLRVQGGASREPGKSPKHSLSFRFRSEYGEGRLRENLFPESEVREFNSIALRAGYNNSWIHSNSGQRGRGSMIRDQWMRESLRDMGHKDAGEGFLAHVFVNGLYWGLHNITERQDNIHYANYNGGDEDTIDARNGATIVNGNTTSWNTLKSIAATRNWENIQKVLDVDAYIDFHIIQRYGGNADLKVNANNAGNWRAAGGRTGATNTEMEPWKLYSWDGERVLESQSTTTVPGDPMGIRGSLEQIDEYRIRYADRARMHLTGDGALTPAKTAARWMKHANAIDKAIIAESARWGDHRGTLYTRNSHWLTEQNRLLNSYFPVRTNNVINRLISDGLYSDVDPPEFTINGGVSEGGYLAPGSVLAANGEDGVVYYTLDGTDPINPDGTIKAKALSFSAGVEEETIFDLGSPGWTYNNLGVAQSSSNVVEGHPSYNSGDWKHPGFDDASWAAGQGPMVGSGPTSITGHTANTVINIGFNPRLPTIYFRKRFNVVNATELNSLGLSMIRDDGVIVYLNGHEIFRDNVGAGTIDYSFYTGTNSDESTIITHTHTLLPGQILEGENVITVEVHNSTASSGDLGLDLGMTASRAVSGNSINLNESSILTARLQNLDGDWSAPVTAAFLLEQPATGNNLAISEINYHPRDAGALEKLAAHPDVLDDAEQFEFIELQNISGSQLNLAGVRFTNGLTFEFGLRIMEPGEHIVLVRNQDAFLHRYPSAASAIAGTFTGRLSNDGEMIRLAESDGSLISAVEYSDGGQWPSRPDGAGSTLQIVNPFSFANFSPNWISSVAFNGSPGAPDVLSDQRIVINEVSSNSASDYIEIYNTTSGSIDIGGWILTDSKDTYHSFHLPAQSLGGMSYLAFDASDYDASPNNPVVNYSGTSGTSPTTVTSNGHGLNSGDTVTISGYGGFSAYNNSFEVIVLNANQFTIDTLFLDNAVTKGNWIVGRPFGISGSSGDDLWLLETDSNGAPLAFVDHVEFSAAAPDTTLGRWSDGAGYDSLITMITPTKAAQNSGPVLGPVYLSEVHYFPTGGESHEFVELSNNSASPVDLDNWRLRGGLDYDFTASHSISAGESLVLVTFDPAVDTALAADFRSSFGLAVDFPLVGPLTDGPLGNEGGTVRLQKPGPPSGAPLTYPQITADEVRYFATNGWPAAAYGAGSSLQRIDPLDFGNFANSWTAAMPTPGSNTPATLDFATWASGLGAGGPDDDPDGDRINNLLEFAQGSNPFDAGEAFATLVSGGQFQIAFNSHSDRSNVDLIFESSTDLENWTTESTTVEQSNGPIDTRQFTETTSSAQKTFYRLRAVITN